MEKKISGVYKITLNALAQRFYKQGIVHPVLEAKKYLLDE